MNLRDMDTDRLADLYVEIAPAIERITEGEHWPEIAETAKGEFTVKALLTATLPKLLKYNRNDVYAILGAVNGKTPEEIAKQPFPKTLAEIRDLATQDFGDFFSLSESEEPKK